MALHVLAAAAGALLLGCGDEPAADGTTGQGTGSTGAPVEPTSTGSTDGTEDGVDGTADDTSTGSLPVVPRLEPVDCRFVLDEYTHAGLDPQCSDLIVWEDEATQSRELRIHVLRFPAADPSGDPVFILNGGPGGSTEGTVLGPLPPIAVQLVTAEFDLVLLDPRGVGRSEPRLGCPLPFDPTADVTVNCEAETAIDFVLPS